MLLLQLSVIAAKVLRESRELTKPRAPILVALLLEREHVLDAQPAMLAGLAERNAPFVQEPNQVLP